MSVVIEFPTLISMKYFNGLREAELNACPAREAIKRRARKWRTACFRFAIARNEARKRGDFRAVEKYTARMHRAAAKYGRLMNQLHDTPSTAAATPAA